MIESKHTNHPQATKQQTTVPFNFLWIFLLLCCFQLQAQRLEHIWEFPSTNISATNLAQNPSILNLGTNDELKVIETKTDQLGWTHHRYQQSHKGFPIEGAQLLFHEKNNQVKIINGAVALNLEVSPRNPISEEQALESALEQINANLYAWDVASYENTFAATSQNSAASLYPKGTLVWVKPAENLKYQLAYRFDIYSVEPLARKFYYVDAQSGLLIKAIDRIALNCFDHDHEESTSCTSETNHSTLYNNTNSVNDVAATGISSYVQLNSGTVDFTSDFNGTNYVLNANNLGVDNNQIIQTVNANSTDGTTITDFLDADNYWEATPVGLSVHWGTIQTYDYFSEAHGRKSYDDLGSPLLSRVHFGEDYVNAFWDGMQMTYGDGDGVGFSALTSLDVVAHELTHGVSQFNGTGGLVYMGESGALNESFSDIFGAVVEFEKHPDGGDWLMGEDFDLAEQIGFRNLQNPLLKGHPKNYYGQSWHTSSSDNFGVHSNSGVQNHWFYLLATGGTGANEYGINYSITGIGLEDAAAIAYRNLVTYLSPEATYEEARAGAVQAAEDLFGLNSAQHIATIEAWCAVGLGTGCHPTISATTPTLSETLTSGVNYQIQWSSTLLPTSALIKIEYTTEEGENPDWQSITTTAPNTGSYDWFVENAPSTTVRIKIGDGGEAAISRPANPNIFDITAIFTIESCLASNSFSYPSMSMANETINFTSLVTGTSYEWLIDGVSLATTKDFSYNFPEAGIYQLTYRVENGSTCINIETQTLRVLSENANGFTINLGNDEGSPLVNQDIIQLSDGNYAFMAFPAMVLKLDHQGQEIWHSETLSMPNDPEWKAVLVEKDNGNILVAYGATTNETGGMFNQLGLVELNATDGTVINNTATIFSSSGDLYPHAILKTDNGFLIGGEIKRNGQKDLFVVELAANNTVLHQAYYGNETTDDFFSDLIPTIEGGFLLTGNYFADYAVMVIKLDATLQEEWANAYYTNYSNIFIILNNAEAKAIELPNCEGYFILAKAGELGATYLLKIDSGGFLESAKHYATNNAYDAFHVFADGVWDDETGLTVLSNYSSLIIPSGGINLVYEADYGLLNLDLEGNINWERTFPSLDATSTHPRHDTKLLKTADGGYLASIPRIWGYGTQTYLMKTDAYGMDICNTQAGMTTVGDVSHALFPVQDLQITLNNLPSIQFAATITATTSASNAPQENICAPFALSSIIPAFEMDRYFIEIGETVNITNSSVGATSYTWTLNGQTITLPLPAFTSSGMYDISLEATDGVNTSTLSKKIHVKPMNCSFCRSNDSLALVALYNSTAGPSWLETWDLNEPMDTWYGVTLNSDGCVICLSLGGAANCNWDYGQGNNLVGTLPEELGDLVELRELWLSQNQLSGPIPSELGNLSNLRSLGLAYNNLSGLIPESLGNLAEARIFHLNDNDLSGTIPSNLGNLTNLQWLLLNYNELTGSIPATLENIACLTNLALSHNQLTGEIPSEFGGLQCLRDLYLSNNNLSGTLPSTLANMSSIRSLTLNHNNLSGVLPPALGDMTSLQSLLLNHNQFTGAIPAELGQLTNINNIKLNDNQFSACFPTELDALCGTNYDFSNNPELPNAGDFAAFCTSEAGACISLAANLLNLKAHPVRSNIQLDWTIHLEENIQVYEIERSINQRDFEKIGLQAALHKNTNTYHFEDKNVDANTVYYYRLKMIEHTGESSFSTVVAAQIKSQESSIQLFPNPATEQCHLIFEEALTGAIDLTIFNALGQIQAQQTTTENQIQFNLKDWPNGLYFIQVLQANKNIVLPFIKE